MELEFHNIGCPYCGEIIEISVDTSVEIQQYIEDCRVCCRPMTLKISINTFGNDEGTTCIEVLDENDY